MSKLPVISTFLAHSLEEKSSPYRDLRAINFTQNSHIKGFPIDISRNQPKLRQNFSFFNRCNVSIKWFAINKQKSIDCLHNLLALHSLGESSSCCQNKHYRGDSLLAITYYHGSLLFVDNKRAHPMIWLSKIIPKALPEILSPSIPSLVGGQNKSIRL